MSSLADPQFAAASAVSATDVWVAGTLGAGGTASAPLIVHYDGTAWRLVVDAVVLQQAGADSP